MNRSYEYRHIVSFEETNLVGNVYYVNHLSWQGRCREMFLREHAPSILTDLTQDFRLVTLRCSCEYLSELNAFDEVIIRMRLGSLTQNRMSLHFEYYRASAQGEQLVAKGEQQIACMRNENGSLMPTEVPQALQEALRPFTGT